MEFETQKGWGKVKSINQLFLQCPIVLKCKAADMGYSQVLCICILRGFVCFGEMLRFYKILIAGSPLDRKKKKTLLKSLYKARSFCYKEKFASQHHYGFWLQKHFRNLHCFILISLLDQMMGLSSISLFLEPSFHRSTIYAALNQEREKRPSKR